MTVSAVSFNRHYNLKSSEQAAIEAAQLMQIAAMQATALGAAVVQQAFYDSMAVAAVAAVTAAALTVQQPARPALEPPKYSEHQDMRRYLKAEEMQREFRQEIRTIVDIQRINDESRFLKVAQEKKFKIQEDAAKMQDNLKVTEYVNTGLTVALVVTFVVGILATIFTGGAALPVVVAATTGVLSVGQGVNTALNAGYQEQMHLLNKDMIAVAADIDRSHADQTAHVKTSQVETAALDMGYERTKHLTDSERDLVLKLFYS